MSKKIDMILNKIDALQKHIDNLQAENNNIYRVLGSVLNKTGLGATLKFPELEELIKKGEIKKTSKFKNSQINYVIQIVCGEIYCILSVNDVNIVNVKGALTLTGYKEVQQFAQAALYCALAKHGWK